MSPRSPLLVWAAGPLYWLLIAAALWLLLRGHSEPGGGFIAGPVAVAASSLLALSQDITAARRWQPLAPLPLAMLGVGLAALAGLPGVLGGAALPQPPLAGLGPLHRSAVRSGGLPRRLGGAHRLSLSPAE